jgi:hypothetical protein
MKRKGLGIGLGKGYKNILPMDKYIHSLSAKGIKTRLQEIMSFTKKSVIPDYDVDKLEKQAIKQKFSEMDDVYVDIDMIKKSDDETLHKVYFRTKKEIEYVFGSIDKYKLFRDFINTYHGYNWIRIDEKKDNKIIGTSSFSVTLPMDSLYNLSYHILKGKYLRDLSKVHTFTDEQKQEYYSESGTVETDLFTFKRYKNGKFEMTFKSEKDCKKFYDTYLDMDMIYNKNRNEFDGWLR